MRVFHGLEMLIPLLKVAGTVFSVIQSFSAASAASDQAEAEARQQEFRAVQEEKAGARERRDLKEEKRRKLARSRAALAGQGALLTGPNATSFLSLEAAEFEIRSRRITEDSDLQAASLRAGASNIRAAGQARKQSFIFGGIAKGALSTASLLKSPG